MSRWLLARSVLAGLLALAPVVAFAGLFGRSAGQALADPGYLLPTAGAALLPAVAGLLLAMTTRIPPVTRLTVELLVLVGYVGLVSPARVTDGPYRLLTSVPPIDPGGPELALVAVLAGLAGIGAVEPSLRRAAVPWALPVPLLAMTAGLCLTTPTGVPDWLAPAVAGTVLAMLATASAAPSTTTSAAATATVSTTASATDAATATATTATATAGPSGRLVGVPGLVLVLAAGAGASLLGPALVTASGDRTPPDPRDLVAQPVRPRTGSSPLAQFPALRTGKLNLRLTVTGDGATERLRYATLDRFDGTYWTSAATYWRAGRQLPAPTGPAELVTQQIRIDQRGPIEWLVSAGRPVEVSLGGLGVDRATGDVIFPENRPAPDGYTVRSAVPRFELADLPVDPPAALPPGAVPAGSVPAGLLAKATSITGASAGYPALRRLADHFARTGGYRLDTSRRPPAGHGLYQIDQLLDTRNGTAEQYASAFAVLARALGYDARVVMGFRPRTGNADRRVITGRDVDAWAEVRFTRAGWVPFHPTPGRSGDRRPDQAEPPPSSPPEPQRTLSAPTPAGSTGTATPPGAGANAGRPGAGPPWLAVTVLVVLTLVVAVGAPPAVKWAVRARRRRLDDPGRRLLAAWRDTLDRCAETGVAVSRASTTGETRATLTGRAPAADLPARELVALVDAAAYGPAAVTTADAERAWALADTVRRQLAVASSRRQRIAAALRIPARPPAVDTGR
ncbi:transglutaminase domain-containing protein [Micromonospora sp. NPDC023956]|uniref:transglutaminase domain-containing protein n=1 Tax=Micromonospora sp. NPDC023956 TaxID=3155722 RepID=UPI0033C9C2B2